MDKKGLMHIYCGDGKGKTTCAMGLAVRALGSGMKVTVVQFLKSGRSSELEMLRKLGANVFSGKKSVKFAFKMTPEERAEEKICQTELLREALAAGPSDLLVMDEACAACAYEMVDLELLKKTILERPEEQEIVLTGRNPADWMVDAADYITEMTMRRHPYKKGIPARKGIEF